MHFVHFGKYSASFEWLRTLSSVLRTPPSGCLFRSLTTLSLVDVYLHRSCPIWTTWLTPSNFPHVVRLAVCLLYDGLLGVEDDDFVDALGRLAPQIRYFTYAEDRQMSDIRDHIRWSAFTSIQGLALFMEDYPGAVLGAALAHLPTATLSHFLVGYGHRVMQGTLEAVEAVWQTEIVPTIEQALQANSGSFPELRTLVLHTGDQG